MVPHGPTCPREKKYGPPWVGQGGEEKSGALVLKSDTALSPSSLVLLSKTELYVERRI